ncbi:MAG: DUF1684 domain-containing protein [Thermoplasmata archaeon]|nr:DUF1684 domain-containing protein [Thermoplasmata archaeon]
MARTGSDRAYVVELGEERRLKDQFMSRHPESPFVDAHIPGFSGLRYFPPNPKFRVPAVLERVDPPQYSYLRTNRDNQAEMRLVGHLRFTLGKRELRLRVYHASGSASTSVFVPFRDLTSGHETYGPGRYLTIDLGETDRYDLDFNRCFNPYSAYTDAYECSFPPTENDLDLPVRAGEKVWAVERNPSSPEGAVREMVDKALKRTPARPPRVRRRTSAK